MDLLASSASWNAELPAGIGASASATVYGQAGTLQDPLSYTSSSHAIAFIDTSLDNYQELVAGVQAGTEVHLLNPLQDEVAQITQILAGQSGITSLAIFSHGNDGLLQLGSNHLDLGDLGSYASEIHSWSQSLAQGADLLFFGCNVAASDLGKTFVQEISHLTGADVGASTDLTGSAAVGGNWNLEYWSGAIESSDILQLSAQAGYNHALATFTVTNTADNGAGSLRQAVLDANAAAGADVINFTGSVFADTTPDTITLTTGQLQISGDLTINGPGATLLTISGNNASRVFQIDPNVNTAIGGVTIANGKAPDVGGGILNNGGSLALINSTLNNNVAPYGGGIANFGGMLVNGGTFNSNTATTWGGGIINFGGLEVRNSTFNTNGANANGGGIYNYQGASLTVDNDIFSKNTAGQFGGGIHNSSGATMSVTTSVITDGRAGIVGGGISNFGTITSLDNTLIRGNSSTSSGGAAGGVYNGGTANITNTSILNNSAAGVGGGIYNDTNATLTLRANSLVSGNRAASGGGIYNRGTARVGESSILSNRLTSSTGVGPDVWGNYISEGFNTIYNARGSTGFSAALGDTIIFG